MSDVSRVNHSNIKFQPPKSYNIIISKKIFLTDEESMAILCVAVALLLHYDEK